MVDEPDDEALAPDPVEGRHSSSVKIVKTARRRAEAAEATKGATAVAEADRADKAATVFARLREEEVVVTATDADGDTLEIEVIETALEAVDEVYAAEAAAQAADVRRRRGRPCDRRRGRHRSGRPRRGAAGAPRRRRRRPRAQPRPPPQA